MTYIAAAERIEMAAAYQRGEAAYDIARRKGVDATTVTRIMREMGVPRRRRGARDAVSEVLAMRLRGSDDNPTSVASIARQLGVSPGAVFRALRRAGIPPSVGVPMTAAQTRRLAQLAAKTPEGVAAYYDFTTTAGQRLLAEIARLRNHGVHQDEIGMVVGASGTTVRRWERMQ